MLNTDARADPYAMMEAIQARSAGVESSAELARIEAQRLRDQRRYDRIITGAAWVLTAAITRLFLAASGLL